MLGGPRAGGQKSTLQVLTELAGLLAAAAAVVYGAGAVVLSLRLAFEHLPWSNIVSGLPREFILSTGAGQAILPAIAVGAVYGLYRALRHRRANLPSVRRTEWKLRSVASMSWRCVFTFVLLLLPLGFVHLVRGTSAFEGNDRELLAGLIVVLIVDAVAVNEGRAAVVERFSNHWQWNSIRATATMVAVYAGAALPAMVLASAATPLTSARICLAGGGAFPGKLVGEAGDRVYLGEEANTAEKEENRRIVVIPIAKIDQLFVGPHPTGAICETS